MQLRTNRVVVTFVHQDGSFAEAGLRAVRVVAEGAHKGKLCVERRSRLLLIEPTSGTTARCNLASAPLVQGYESAQAVAPVATLAQLGIVKAGAKAAETPKASNLPGTKAERRAARQQAQREAQASTKPAEPEAPANDLDAAIATLRDHMAGKPLAEAQAILTALVTIDSAKPSQRQRKR